MTAITATAVHIRVIITMLTVVAMLVILLGIALAVRVFVTPKVVMPFLPPVAHCVLYKVSLGHISTRILLPTSSWSTTRPD
jgi:hypothetical protein